MYNNSRDTKIQLRWYDVTATHLFTRAPWNGGGNSTTTKFQRLFPNPSWMVWGRAFRNQKLAPTFPWIENCLMVTKRDFLEMEASLWLNKKSRVSLKVGFYLMLLGSSRPYPWLFSEKMNVKLMMMMMMKGYIVLSTRIHPKLESGLSNQWSSEMSICEEQSSWYTISNILINSQSSDPSDQLSIIRSFRSTLNHQILSINSQSSDPSDQLSIIRSFRSTLNHRILPINSQSLDPFDQLSIIRSFWLTLNHQILPINYQSSDSSDQLSIIRSFSSTLNHQVSQ